MPELPEITVICRQMNKEILGKQVYEIRVNQPKCLNMPVKAFAKIIVGSRTRRVSSKGKWLFLKLDSNYYLLMNLGMGANLLYFKPDGWVPEKFQFKLTFTDSSGFTIRFFWFGYIHLVHQKELGNHRLTANLGVAPLDGEFTKGFLQRLLAGRRGRIKPLLLDQKNIAGIGNVYIQDILFNARIHPNRVASTLSEREVGKLHEATKTVLQRSIEKGGLAYEMDFYGQKGNFKSEDFQVGYKTGKPCPACSNPIEKIRTGQTASYICSRCQRS
ncbi:MAG: Fpg/Nei family DNA glycosylase [Candidatus Bathyarchaeota archaeon]|nr:MAG: Fpg/Nei family DNA glycosylase [Candidatus Bathyarchaeota archaeon]